MDKEAFLRSEYERILASGDYVWSAWRDSFDRFQAELWDMVPSWRAGRHLAPRDKELGFGPGNVEWHFRKAQKIVKSPKTAKKPLPEKAKVTKVPPPTAAEKKRLEMAAREERRQRLAGEFRRWEEIRALHVAEQQARRR